MDKGRRQHKILNLIQAKPVATQRELLQLLERSGVEATQSSVSRDLEELGIIKRRGRYLAATNGDRVAARGLLGLTPAGDFLIVARCEPGLASAVALEIDQAGLSEVAGTLAGEDTVFIAISERKARKAAMKSIWQLFD